VTLACGLCLYIPLHADHQANVPLLFANRNEVGVSGQGYSFSAPDDVLTKDM
jgi:hypothetical protein